MSINFKTIFNGLKIKAKALLTSDTQGELEVDSVTGKLNYHNGTTRSPAVTEAHSATLTNKTIDANGTGNSISNLETADLASGVLNTSTTLATASDTQIPSALAVKTYVDNGLAAQNAASEISYNNATSGLTATNVQDAIDEVEARLDTAETNISNVTTDLSDHLNDTVDAHIASSIGVTPVGNLDSVEVQAALEELQADVDSREPALGFTPEDSANKGIANGYASLDADGLVPVTQMPPAALERLIIVADQTARFALTTASAQNGDTVKQVDTAVMYFIVDDSNLGNAAGYSIYTAGTASSVPWSGVTGTTGVITNTEINASAAIARSKLASGTNNTLIANNGSGVMSDVSDITVGTNNLTLANTKHVEIQAATDSSTTGSNASLASFTGGAIRLTNASLVSLANIPAGNNGQQLEIFNRTGAVVSIIDSSNTVGTAANRILTGSSSDVTLDIDASLSLSYDSTTARWQIIGGSGGGANLTGDVTSVGTLTTYNGTVPLNKGGTGQTTKAPAFDALQPMSASGDIIYGGASGTGTRLPVGTSGQTLRVSSGIPAWGEYNPDNLLVNPSFEGSNTAGVATGWTNSSTNSTPTITTTSGEFSSGLQAQKIALAAGVLNFSQSVNTPAGIQKQGVVGILYKSTIATFQVCSLVDAAEQTCVPSANLILDGLYHSIEIPITFGSTSAGIKVKAASATGDAFIDAAYVKQGIGTQNLMTDYDYTAQVSATGVISGLSKAGWLSGNCVVTNTSQYDCPIASGLVTTQMNCQLTAQGAIMDDRSAYYDYTNSSSSNIRYRTTNSSNAAATAYAMSLKCSKTGNDYLAASANVYSQAQSAGVFVQAAGAAAAATAGNPIIYPTIGSDTTNGAYSASTGLFTVVQAGYYDVTSYLDGTIAAGQACYASVNGNTTAGYNRPSFGQVSVVNYPPSGTVTVYASAGQTISVRCTGNLGVNTNANLVIKKSSANTPIIGSFSGYTNVPGYSGNVDTFSFSYGTTNATTACSASPCSYLDQIGTALTSVTRTSAGLYVGNLSKSYLKIKCSQPYQNQNYSWTPINSASANTITWTSINGASTPTDSYGTIMCQGSY